MKIADNTDLWKLKAKHEFEKNQPRTQAEETIKVEFSVRNPSSLPLPCTDYTVYKVNMKTFQVKVLSTQSQTRPPMITAILHAILQTHLDLDANFSLPRMNLQ